MNSKFDGNDVTCTRPRRFTDTFSQWNSCWKIKNTWTHDRKQMLLPDAHLCYLILTAARPREVVPLHGATIYFASNAPTESCRCTTRIPWYHQNPAYTHRILFARTAWYWKTLPCYMIQKWLPIASYKYENRISLYYVQSIAHLTFVEGIA